MSWKMVGGLLVGVAVSSDVSALLQAVERAADASALAAKPFHELRPGKPRLRLGKDSQRLTVEGRIRQRGLHKVCDLIAQRRADAEAEGVDVLCQAESAIHQVEVVGQTAKDEVGLQYSLSAPAEVEGRCHQLNLMEGEGFDIEAPREAVVHAARVLEEVLNEPRS